MTGESCGSRPSPGDMKVALGLVRAALSGASVAAVHARAESARCPDCTAAALAGFTVTLAMELTSQPFVTEHLARRLMDAIAAAEAELGAAGN